MKSMRGQLGTPVLTDHEHPCPPVIECASAYVASVSFAHEYVCTAQARVRMCVCVRVCIPMTRHGPELVGLADDDLLGLLLAGVVLEHVLVDVVANLQQVVHHRLVRELVDDLIRMCLSDQIEK